MKLEEELVSVTVPAQACARPIGTAVGDGSTTGAGLGTAPGVDAELYVASNPAAFTDPSDEKATYSWPLGDDTVTPDLVPVMVSASGAVDDMPLYTLTKS